jgi:hypothetical protein
LENERKSAVSFPKLGRYFFSLATLTFGVQHFISESGMQAIGTTPNGKRYFNLFLEEERAGDVVKAHAHLKTAVMFEPKNSALRAKLDAVEAQLKELRKKAKPSIV